MMKRLSPFLAMAMALIFVNTSLAEVDRRLCRTQCEYSVPERTVDHPCCSTGKNAGHDMATAETGSVLPDDCPHIDGPPDPADFLVLLSSSPRLSVAPTGTLFPAADIRFPLRLPVTGYAHTYGWPALSRPERQGPPPYRLNCSLLI